MNPKDCCCRSPTHQTAVFITHTVVGQIVKCHTAVRAAMQAGCIAISNLCKEMDADIVRPHDVALLASLIPNLTHQHSKVRMSTLAALDKLVLKVRTILHCHYLLRG